MGGLLAAQLGDGCSSPGSVDTGGRPSYGPLIGAATRAHAFVCAPMAPGVGFYESAYTAPDGGVRARPGCCPGCSGDCCFVVDLIGRCLWNDAGSGTRAGAGHQPDAS